MAQWKHDDIIALAQDEILEIDFIKKNGDRRIMTCTLREDMLPPIKTPKTKLTEEAKEPPKSMPIWDINAQGWRSFLIANIESVTVMGSE